MEYYIGVDLSLSATGLVVLNGIGKIVDSKILNSKKRETERLLDLEYQLEKAICNYIPVKSVSIFIENFSFGSRLGQAFSIGEWAGVAKALLKKKGYDYILVAPTSLKKFVTGKGNAKKELMMLEVFKKYGESFSDNNSADAFGLARIAWSCDNQENLLKYEKEVIKKIEEGKE